MTRNERLREARIKAGFSSAAEAARRLNVPYGTYSGHENGSRGIKDQEIFKYAKIFKVSPIWLLFGTEVGDSEPKYLDVMGRGGHLPDGQIELLSEDEAEGEILKEVSFWSETSYIKVVGSNLRGIAEDGWLIFADRRISPPNSVGDGTLCICLLEDGRCFCRFLYSTKDPNLFDLEAPLHKTERAVAVKGVFEVFSLVTAPTAEFMRQAGAAMLVDYRRAEPLQK